MLFSLFLFAILAYSHPAFAAKCEDKEEAYEKDKYTVRHVRIDTPVDWLFGSVGDAIKRILTDKDMPIKAHHFFTTKAFDDGFIFVNNNFNPLQAVPKARFAARLAYPFIENCDGSQLDVVYRVYSLSLSNYLIRNFELGGKREVSRAVPETQTTSRLAHFYVQPNVGYNRSRAVFGGASLLAQIPSRFINNVSLESSGSTSSSEVGLDASGSRERERGLIRYTEWNFEYFRDDIQEGALDLKRATGRAQILAATRPIGDQELTLRFGGAIEGGNRQTDENAAELPADALASSGHKAIKLFVGASMNAGRHDFKASYGVQFGNAGEGTKIDYIKQVFDAGANLRLFPWDHHYPIALEGRFAAGIISNKGVLPVAERFFGGNVEENFLSGSTWGIQSNPFIRSYPQNRFAYARAGDVFGGERFVSANLTIVATVWAEPLVPKEVMNYCARPKLPSDETAPENPEDGTCLSYDEAVEIALSVAESSIKSSYLSEKKKFREMTENVKSLAKPLEELRGELSRVRQNSDPAVQTALTKLYDPPPPGATEASGSFAYVHKTTKKILADIEDEKVTRGDVKILAVGVRNEPSYIQDMAVDLEALAALLPSTQAASITALRGTFAAQGEIIKTKFDEAMKTTEAAEAETQAKEEMRYPTRVMKELSHEANLYSFSPVAFFDVARLWQSPNQPGDVRRGAGVGGRFSLLSFDVTAGYSWNIHPRPGEGRGAFVFSLGLSNLFR